MPLDQFLRELEADPVHQREMQRQEEERSAVLAAEEPEWQRIRDALETEGIDATDLGVFVSNIEFFTPSTFDEQLAMPVLLAVLPTLTLPQVVQAVAGHLRRPWARPEAYGPLRPVFVDWAARDSDTAWCLGHSLGTAAEWQHLDDLLEIAQTQEYGFGRAMVVDALWRFRKDDRVEQVVRGLLTDIDVARNAMSGFRRVVGNHAALPVLQALAESHPDPDLRGQAREQVQRATKSSRR